MNATINLFSNKAGEINRFLSDFYNTNIDIAHQLKWEKKYANPIELAEIIGAYIDNFEDYLLTMWICLDKNIFINITPKNGNSFIKYLYERFPY